MGKHNRNSGDIRDRVVELKRVPARELREHPENWRIHPEVQRDALGTVMSEIGFAGAVLAYPAEDGALVLVDGHLRRDAAGDTVIPVLVTDLTEDEAAALLAVYDPIADMAEVNREKQKALLDRMAKQKEAFEGLAQQIGEVTGVQVGDEPEQADDPGAQIDRAEELREKWGTERGQLWIIPSKHGGEHRLLCGDSTDAGDVARVMGGEKAGCAFFDPPYATFASSSGKMESGDFKMITPFFRDVINQTRNSVRPGRGVFVCCDWRSYPMLAEVAFSRLAPKNLIVWAHKAPKLGSHFRPSYELILYALNANFAERSWTNKTSSDWKIQDRSLLDVWEIPQKEAAPGVNRQHISQKPVALAAHAIQHTSNPDEAVYDPFGGSGTTMVACEQLGRQCRMIEIEPKYCAVILERMAGMGLEPRLSDG